MYKIIEEEGKFGIEGENENYVIPPTHETAKEAIDELVYFLELNQRAKDKFLGKRENSLSPEDIHNIKTKLYVSLQSRTSL